ncbi:MAG: TRAP transporter small permease [Pseudomonadota bacterium]
MLTTAVKRTTVVMEWVGALTLALMVSHVLADVIGRQVFGQPAPATTEVVAFYYMVAAVFLPLPFVELRNRAIAVDLFYNMFPRGLQRFSIMVATLATAVLWGTLAVKSSFDAVEAFGKGEMIDGTYTVPIWPIRFALPVAFGLATVVVLLRFVNEGIRGRSHDPSISAETI